MLFRRGQAHKKNTMAKYDYKCVECDILFEVQRKMSDDSAINCDTCGNLATRSINYAPPVKFVGEGFFTNDSKHVQGSIFDAGQSHELA